MKRSRGKVDAGIFPLLLVILIPLAVIAFAIWGTGSSAPSRTPTETTQQTNAQPSASIALDNSTSLPVSVAAGEFVPFSFTITNTSGFAGDIPYKVNVKWSTGEQDVIDVNVASLTGGESKTISENLKFELANENAQVSLELTQTGKTVEFTLPRVK